MSSLQEQFVVGSMLVSTRPSTRSRLVLFIAVVLVGLSFIVLTRVVRAAPQMIYDDALATGWEDYSWANVNLQATTPVHSGSRSIAVTYSGWDGLYLYHPGQSTIGYTYLRFFVHGGSTGGQHFQVFANRADGGSTSAIAVPLPAANVWSEVKIALTDLGAADTDIVGLTWQGKQNGGQPT